MVWRLLLDENLSPQVALRLAAAGYDATCIHHRGLLGHSDEEVFRWSVQEGYIVVTNNAADFERIANDAASERVSHHGIIIVRETTLDYTFNALLTFLQGNTPGSVDDRVVVV